MGYPTATYAAGKSQGYEYSPSPSQGGTLLTIAEDDAVAPNDPVELYDPCIASAITGICVGAPSAAGEDMVLQTAGIFSLPIVASDNVGTSAVAVGNAIYITDATGVLSKDATTGHTLFGYAMAATGASATAALIPVKLKTV